MDLMEARRRLLMRKKSRLPSEYQEVEYIETDYTGLVSNQGAYIDTGVYADQNTSYFYDFQLKEIKDSDIFGTGRTWMEPSLEILLKQGTYFAIARNRSGNVNIFVNGQPYEADLARHTITQDKENVYFDGDYIHSIGGTDEFITELPIFLFRSTRHGFIGMKVYSCIIKENGIDVRNFVPCYRKSDGEIGMYDTINGVFYANANSTGSFTKGQDI